MLATDRRTNNQTDGHLRCVKRLNKKYLVTETLQFQFESPLLR